MLCPHFVLFLPGGGSDPDKVEDDAEDSGGEEKEKGEGEEDLEDYLNDPDFQNMSDSEGDDLPLFEVPMSGSLFWIPTSSDAHDFKFSQSIDFFLPQNWSRGYFSINLILRYFCYERTKKNNAEGRYGIFLHG